MAHLIISEHLRTGIEKKIRVIKNNKSIYSYRDAQGFRKGNNEKLNVKQLNAYIYHYGWIRNKSDAG